MPLIHPAFVEFPIGSLFSSLFFCILAYFMTITKGFNIKLPFIQKYVDTKNIELAEKFSYATLFLSLFLLAITALTGLMDAGQISGLFDFGFVIRAIYFINNNTDLTIKVRFVMIGFSTYLLLFVFRQYTIRKYNCWIDFLLNPKRNIIILTVHLLLNIAGFAFIAFVSATGGNFYFGDSLVPTQVIFFMGDISLEVEIIILALIIVLLILWNREKGKNPNILFNNGNS